MKKVDNSNIIISVIIVLCIAAGVTAYGISEGDNAVFTDLSGFSPDSLNSGNDGIGNASIDNSNNGSGSLISAPANSGGSSGSGSGSSGSSSGSGSGSSGSSSSSGSGSSGSSSSSGSGSSGGGSQTTDIGYDASLQKAQSLAGDAAFVSSSDAGTYRIFYFKKAMPESDQSNYTTDTFAISIDKATGAASLY